MILVEPAGVRREISIETSPFRIGRQTGNELVVRDSRVSRQQAQIIIQDGIVIVEDLGSRHGTFVNGERVTRHQLSPQDAIEFGVPDSHRLIYAGEETRVEELLERMELPAPPHSGSRELYHLGVLLEVARTMGTGLSLEDVLTSVVDAAIQVTRTERGVLLLTDAKGELITSVARDAQRATLKPESLQISSSVLKRVAQSRRELIVSDTGDDTAMQQQASVARLELHTIIAIPLDRLPTIEASDATVTTRQAELLGILYLDSHSSSSAFSQLDREVLRTLAAEAARVVENAKLVAAARAKMRLDHELEIASQIQRELLPKTFPDLPSIAVHGSTLACQAVGGDCYDVISLQGGRYGFFVGDVAGKGITAALLATLLQGVFYTTAALDIPLGEVVSRVNDFLVERSSEDRYATAFYGVLNPEGALEYVNAGHVPPLIRRRGGALEPLGSGNFPVGMFPQARYDSAQVKLEPGDWMVIYSDGVTEAYNLGSELFGEERLCRLLEGVAGETVTKIAAEIQSAVKSFTEGAPQSDDITLVVVQYRGQIA